MSELTRVYFLKGVPPFNAGERAGLKDGEAQKCFANGWAVPVDEDGEPVFPEPEDEEEGEEEADEGKDDGEEEGAQGEGKDEDGNEVKGTPLPEDFPGRKALIEADLQTVEMVATVKDQLGGVKGIGQATEVQILEYLKKLEA